MPNKFTTTGYPDIDCVVRELIKDKEANRFGQLTVYFDNGNVDRVERKEVTKLKDMQARLPGFGAVAGK